MSGDDQGPPEHAMLRRPGKRVDTGDVTLWCDEEGEGEPLVLVGGFGAGHHIWDFVWPLLSDYRRVTLEPRGLGASDCPPPPYGVEIWAADLEALLDTLGIERAHLWATGFGTYYAVKFAADNPERVGGFVAYTDVWAGDPVKDYERIWRVYGTIIDTFGTSGFGGKLLTNMFSVPWLPWFPEWEAENLAEVLHPEFAAATAGYCLTEADVREDLDRIEAPMMVLEGSQGWFGEEVSEEADPSLAIMRERVADFRVKTIPESHPAYVIAHKPGECVQAVLEFLSETPL